MVNKQITFMPYHKISSKRRKIRNWQQFVETHSGSHLNMADGRDCPFHLAVLAYNPLSTCDSVFLGDPYSRPSSSAIRTTHPLRPKTTIAIKMDKSSLSA